MILTGHEILREYAAHRILIEPFDVDQLNPNSYNFRLGAQLSVYRHHPVDPRQPNPVTSVRVPGDGIILRPHRLYLAHTLEVMAPCDEPGSRRPGQAHDSTRL
jgi:deoxycytidine triphosphate deaminase